MPGNTLHNLLYGLAFWTYQRLAKRTIWGIGPFGSGVNLVPQTCENVVFNIKKVVQEGAMKWMSNSWRVWLFRTLVAAAAGLMVTSAIMPWWVAKISAITNDYTVTVYQYGIPYSSGASEWRADLTPGYQLALGHIYIAVSIGLLLFSTWIKGARGRWLLGGVGLIYIVYASIAIVWCAVRAQHYGILLQGYSLLFTEEKTQAPVYANAAIQLGYYLALVSGFVLIILALLRNLIAGKHESSVR